MNDQVSLKHVFVDFIPDKLDDLTVYVSIEYATAVHKCCCGCGHEVVTPITPTDWKLVFDGVSISLDPSIGNWDFECRSHYWIKHNKVVWAGNWSQERIETGRASDSMNKSKYFHATTKTNDQPSNQQSKIGSNKSHQKSTLWTKLRHFFLK